MELALNVNTFLKESGRYRLAKPKEKILEVVRFESELLDEIVFPLERVTAFGNVSLHLLEKINDLLDRLGLR